MRFTDMYSCTLEPRATVQLYGWTLLLRALHRGRAALAVQVDAHKDRGFAPTNHEGAQHRNRHGAERPRHLHVQLLAVPQGRSAPGDGLTPVHRHGAFERLRRRHHAAVHVVVLGKRAGEGCVELGAGALL